MLTTTTILRPMSVRALTVIVVLAVLVAGCQGSTAIPEGFVTVEGEGFSMVVPEGWQVTAQDPARTAITGVADVEEVFESAIVQLDEAFTGDFRAATRAIIEPYGLFTVMDLEEVEEREVAIDGASQALVVEVTFASEVFDGRTRQYLVFAIPDEAGPLLFVQMGAPEPVFDRDTFDTMLESIELRV